MEQLIPLPVFLVFHWHFTLVDSHRSPDTGPYKYIYISIELNSERKTLSSFAYYYDS